MPKHRTSRAGQTAPAKPTAQWRDDLNIQRSEDSTGTGSYLVEDPVSRETYSFGEEEFFLCQAMDGTSSANEILQKFETRFGMDMSPEHFRNFEEHLLATGLARVAVPEDPAENEAAPEPSRQAKKPLNPQWTMFNPAGIFVSLLRLCRPFAFLVTLSLWALIPAIPIALIAIFRDGVEFGVDLRTLGAQLGYLGGLLFGMVTANLARCLVQGVVMAHYGIVPQEFGIKLRRGILPRFYIEKSKAKGMDRNAKLWIYGTSILVRLYFIVGGVLVWSLFKDGTTLLPLVAVMIAQAGLIGLVIQLLPIASTDGYRWLVTYFNLPPNMLFIALKVLELRLQGKPLPATLSGWTGWRYLVYAVVLVAVLIFASIKIIGLISAGFTQLLPDILGRATPYIFVAIVALFVLRWLIGLLMRRKSHPIPSSDAILPGEETQGFAEFFRRHRGLVILVLIGLTMFIPFAYRPGGEIQVLPPLQQQVQAPVSGKIAEVHFDGGDGRLIPKGTLIAKMVSNEIENELLTLEQSRSQQLATIDKAKSELAKLQSGARTEEITGAEAKLEQTIDQMSVASQEWESAKVSATYSAMVLPRMQQLYKSGSLALLQYEEAKKAADIDRINVEKAAKNLASLTKARNEAQAQLDLLKSGARAEDINSARHTVEAAQANLSRIEQQIVYTRQQQTESALLMPFEGYLVDSHLDFKKGTYLTVGEVYATAQNNSQPLVEVQLPEYDMEGVEVGATAQVRLFAYPNSSLTGKVLSIQPAALPSSSTTSSMETVARMFRVLIEVEKPPFALKAGMTGYAKINAGFQPLGLLLARPIVRFVQIEMWSWLP